MIGPLGLVRAGVLLRSRAGAWERAKRRAWQLKCRPVLLLSYSGRAAVPSIEISHRMMPTASVTVTVHGREPQKVSAQSRTISPQVAMA